MSRTIFRNDHYKFESIAGLLDRLGCTRADYEKNGMFVLRSVVMNPLHRLAERAGKDYLYDLLTELHRVAGESVSSK